MLPRVNPPLDPLAHKTAIDALEGQRAAYRRYARSVEAQQATVGDGDGARAVTVSDAVTRDFVALDQGARRLQPLVERVREAGTPDQLAELQRQMEEMMREARQAETAIRNLTSQLEAWRDAYGRQLAEVGLTPGAGTGGDAAPAEPPEGRPTGGHPARGPYDALSGRHGRQPRVLALLDRRG